MEVRNASFSAFIDLLTPNTYVMVIMSDPDVCKFAVMCAYIQCTLYAVLGVMHYYFMQYNTLRFYG